MPRTIDVKTTERKPYAKKTLKAVTTKAPNAPNAPKTQPFVTIDGVKLGDILVEVDSDGAIHSLIHVLGVVDKINAKSVSVAGST